jgi:hypothetical protein
MNNHGTMWVGWQKTPFWVSGTTGPYQDLRTERFIRLRMPWKRRFYDINHDEMAVGHPTLCIYWYKPAAAALIIRMAWRTLL